MTILTTIQLRPGMCLISDVRDMRGRLLLGQGETLSDKHLKIFRTWGITEANVEVEEESVDVLPCHLHAFDPARHAVALAYVREKFRFNDLSHPFINELFNHAVLLRYRALEETGAAHGR